MNSLHMMRSISSNTMEFVCERLSCKCRLAIPDARWRAGVCLLCGHSKVLHKTAKTRQIQAIVDEADYMSGDILALARAFDEEREQTHLKRKAKEKQDFPKKFLKLQDRMAEERNKGLEQSIPKTNIGHKMLAAMGYKEGQGIGKREEGRIVPVAVTVKAGRAGLGREAQVVHKQRAHMAKQRAQTQSHLSRFRSRARAEATLRKQEKDIPTARRVCETLDRRKGVQDNPLWIDPHAREEGKITDPFEDQNYLLRQDGSKELEAGMSPKEIDEALTMLLRYLRDAHQYCLHCGIEFKDQKDMLSNCPGIQAADHDAEDL